MNISELMMQLYNLAHSLPSQSKMKRKSKKYFKQLTAIKAKMVEEDIYDPSVNTLTSLLYAFNRNITHMNLYGNNPKDRKAILNHSIYLEREIAMVIEECKMVLMLQRSLKVRHTV